MINIFLRSKLFSKIFQKVILNLHTKTYILSSIFAINLNHGIHPKHKIIKYEEWFVENISKNDVVLDIGCNTGIMTQSLSHKARYVYGIEIDKKKVNIANTNSKKDNIQYICADAAKYNYSDCKPIDVVTLSNVLEHIEHRVEFLKKLTNQIKWKNKSIRKLLIRVPLVDRDWIVIYKKELGLRYKLDRTHFTEYTYYEFKNELLKCGIQIKSYHIRFGEIYAICQVL